MHSANSEYSYSMRTVSPSSYVRDSIPVPVAYSAVLSAWIPVIGRGGVFEVKQCVLLVGEVMGGTTVALYYFAFLESH